MLHAVVCGCPLSRGGAPGGGLVSEPCEEPTGVPGGASHWPSGRQGCCPNKGSLSLKPRTRCGGADRQPSVRSLPTGPHTVGLTLRGPLPKRGLKQRTVPSTAPSLGFMSQ